MSQRTKRKRRIALQIAAITAIATLVGCATAQKVGGVHASSGSQAKTLSYLSTIDKERMGSASPVKAFIAGKDINDLNRPTAIGIRGNTMYIADAGVGVIFRYNLSTKQLKPLLRAGDLIVGEVTDIYVNSDFSFFAADNLGKQVFHFSPSGGLIKVYSDEPNVSRPIAVSFDEKSGQLAVADEFYSHIVFFDSAGKPIRGIGGRGEGNAKFRMITDMIQTSSGFYVSDRIEYAVQQLNKAGNYQTHFGDREVIFPTALAMDKDGRIFVGDKSDSTIKVFKNGKLIDTVGKNGYGNGEFRYISDMKLVEDTLYVVDSLNGRIQTFKVLSESGRKS
ncbi:MAG: 6-bladed beta-propeller [Gammaproteobacteria bacterium]|nr:6-bladed beta-propeller [Gammaproteobacteria bacterium]MDH5692918.1 6-bladed beta-propeller [Gammaproteobacteria bacterium]